MKFNSNMDIDMLKKANWQVVGDEYENIVVAAMDRIRRELDRVYWNRNNKEMSSPFENTGNSYSNDTFVVRAYQWDENVLPNFDSEKLKVFWYKHSSRGVYALVPANMNVLEAVNEMLNTAMDSLRKEDRDVE